MKLTEITADETPIVYHYGSFTKTDIPREGMHWGSIEAAMERGNGMSSAQIFRNVTTYKVGGNWYWKDTHFNLDSRRTDDKFGSEIRAKIAAHIYLTKNITGDERTEYLKQYITSATLSVKNPFVSPDVGDDWSKTIIHAKSTGHDGIRYVNKFEDAGSTSWIIFEPQQVNIIAAP